MRNGTKYFVARVMVPDGRGGKRRAEVWAKSVTDRREKVRALLRDASKKKSAGGLTLASYLQTWVDTTARRALAPSSFLRYETLVRLHLKPAAADVALAGLGVAEVLALYERMREMGRSDAVVYHASAVLTAALTDAVPAHIEYNPAVQISRRNRPKYRAPEILPYTLEEMQTFLRAARGHECELLFVLALTSQLREGEIFTLRIADVDLSAGAVFVARSAQDQFIENGDGTIARNAKGNIRQRVGEGDGKSNASRRRVDLPDVGVAALRAQIARLSARGQKTGLLFADNEGRIRSRARFLREDVYPLMKEAGLRQITFHALRHSGNTAMADRVPLVALMYRLGHSSQAMTKRYTHNTPEISAVAVNALNDLFPAALLEHWGEDGGMTDLPAAVGQSTRARKSRQAKVN